MPGAAIRGTALLGAALLGATLLAAGCAPRSYITHWSLAEDALKDGRFRDAIEHYDRHLEQYPFDKGTEVHRDVARGAVLRLMITGVGTARKAGDGEAAANQLEAFLNQRDAWKEALEPSSATAATQEVNAAGAYLERTVKAQLQAGEPLTAEGFVHSHDGLLGHADLAHWRDELPSLIKAAGQTSCKALAPKATSPYATWAIAAYCAHWGEASAAVPVLPNQLANLVVEGTVEGETDDQSGQLRDALSAAFRTTAWFGPSATGEATASLEGKIAASAESRQAVRFAPWSEQVETTENETVNVPYEERYRDFETYTVQVQADSGPQTVERRRPVWRSRTAYREEVQAVSRMHPEPRVLQYVVNELTGHYASSFALTLGNALPERVVNLAADEAQKALDHDVDFAPAGIAPVHQHLMTLPEFVTREQGRLADQLRSQLDEQYAAKFCTLRAFTPEDAAACAYLDAGRLSGAGHTALAGIFGREEPLVDKLLVRPGKP